MKIFQKILLASIFFTLLLPVPSVSAQSADTFERRAQQCGAGGRYWDGTTGTCLDSCGGGSFLGLPAWYQYLDRASVNGRCEVFLPQSGGETDVTKTVSYIALAVVDILLRIAALVAVGYIIYGGYRFILSQGEPENAKSARQTVINALIGLIIALASAAIVSFVARRLTG